MNLHAFPFSLSHPKLQKRNMRYASLSPAFLFNLSHSIPIITPPQCLLCVPFQAFPFTFFSLLNSRDEECIEIPCTSLPTPFSTSPTLFLLSDNLFFLVSFHCFHFYLSLLDSIELRYITRSSISLPPPFSTLSALFMLSLHLYISSE